MPVGPIYIDTMKKKYIYQKTEKNNGAIKFVPSSGFCILQYVSTSYPRSLFMLAVEEKLDIQVACLKILMWQAFMQE